VSTRARAPIELRGQVIVFTYILTEMLFIILFLFKLFCDDLN
jgi:hypothetical protein